MFVVLPILIIIALVVWIRHYGGSPHSTLDFEGDTAPRLRISVIVVDNRDVDYIASMISLESNSYEVVLVADFSSDPNSLHTLSQRFGLIKVNYTPSGELPDEAIEGLYRSFRRIYSRLVVVDSKHSNHYSPFEVGAAVSRYDYTLQIQSRRTLRHDAIDNLLLELATRTEGSVDSIGSLLFERFHLSHREELLPQSSNNRYRRRGKNIKIDYRILK